MASKRQLRANRRNACRSTGPKSAAGKAKSSANALRHGLTAARTVVLPGESAAAFERFKQDVVADLEPGDALQAALAERIAVLLWRLDRAARLEAEVFTHGHLVSLRERMFKAAHRGLLRAGIQTPGDEGSGDRGEDGLTEAMREIDEEIHTEAPSAKVLVERDDSARTYDRLARHEGALQRALNRTLEDFSRLRAASGADAAADAAPDEAAEAGADASEARAEAAETGADAAADAERRSGEKVLFQNEANSPPRPEAETNSRDPAEPPPARDGP